MQPAGDDWLSGLDVTCLDQNTLKLNPISDTPSDRATSENYHAFEEEGLNMSNAQERSEEKSCTHHPSDPKFGGVQQDFQTDEVYPSRSSVIVLTLALMNAVFMIALDTNIIGSPRMSK